jgi:ParB-like chromosome segregation protein Spo0J
MSPDELRALGADIKQNGLTSPIAVVVTKLPRGWSYQLLDGINRLDAMEAVGIQFRIETRDGRCTVDLTDSGIRVDDVRRLMSFAEVVETDPVAFVISTNIHRRHLSAEDKRDLIAKLLKADPSKSDRRVAETVKASPTTVGSVRAEMEAKGDVSKLDTRRDSKGREQPSRRKQTTKPQTTPGKNAPPARQGNRSAPTSSGATEAKPDANDIGPNSAPEAERLRVRNAELENENTRLRREIEEAKAAPDYCTFCATRDKARRLRPVCLCDDCFAAATDALKDRMTAHPLDIPACLDRTKRKGGASS